MESEQTFSLPVTELVKKRFSCRTYKNAPLAKAIIESLENEIASLGSGPFGNRGRFMLAVNNPIHHQTLRGLGTYGFIKDANAFIIGAIQEDARRNLEDYGYLMEWIILKATDLGLGTCWLGGTFTKSSFAKKIKVQPGELTPAVMAIGYPATSSRLVERMIRQRANAERRLPWQKLFFDGNFQLELSRASAGVYRIPLEMVQLGPSASNKQPWRVVRNDLGWHFYLSRSPGYRERPLVRLFTVADMQRIDMGIAMCHFELTAREAGLKGRWFDSMETGNTPLPGMEYTASWMAE